ncbi:DoxX family protein [Occallatibacter riparius]|uniref:DoxX family protein n=1 Tax=Occallatibacter riparius TaxID=1002689 RepID=A0A9J7BKR9_9BACT|nr:DoxX family protein [Occallatibacter riparius]UWZ82370.1 DoxX family protein [Occallatibacter riparius]
MTEFTNAGSVSRFRTVAYWVTTMLVAFELTLGGLWDVLQVPQVRSVMERLGYPMYFLSILGIWKLLGAIALLVPRFPRLKEWAYAGVIFDLTGAVASQLASGWMDPANMTFPIVMIGLAAGSWALRPASRRGASGYR